MPTLPTCECFPTAAIGIGAKLDGIYCALLEVIAAGAGLPDQSGHAGEFLTTNGTDPSWVALAGGGGGGGSMHIAATTLAGLKAVATDGVYTSGDIIFTQFSGENIKIRKLKTGSTNSDPDQVRPNDYDAGTNNVFWNTEL